MASNKELQAEIDALRAQVAAGQQALADANKVKAKGNGELSFKVSAKGAVSVYGLGRFPVTLYSEQWPRLFAATPRLIAFMDANRANLSTKANPILASQAVPVLARPVAAEDYDAAQERLEIESLDKSMGVESIDESTDAPIE